MAKALTKRELEDAFEDWYFSDGGWLIHSDLEKRGYIHQFYGQDLSEMDLSGFGSYALVVDEFSYGDLLYTKKIWVNPKLWKELGLLPITPSTLCAARTAWVLSQFGDDEIIELIDTRERKGAVLSGSRTHWHQAAVVHPCARPSCKWQGSVFDEFGPVTHVEADTKEDAVKELLEYNSHWEPHPGAVDEVFTQMEKFKYPLHGNPDAEEVNPPFSGWRENWWLEKRPRDETKIAYRRKRDALNVFMDWNQSLIDLAFNGPSQKQPTDSFDNFNHKYDLKGKRKIDTFAKAVWFALPAGAPYYIENIDVNMLNDTSPMRHNAEEGILTIPDFAEERRLVDLEAAYWQEKYGDIFPEEEEGEEKELEEAPF
jgi:hypothetical protein